MRIGIGYDIHRIYFYPENNLVIGGVKIPANFSLHGHSDADVLLHALTDAFLGALAIGDIGYYFSDKDNKNKARNSQDFVLFAWQKVIEANYTLANLDCNIICEKPKLQPYYDSIRKSIATLLNVPIQKVSTKGRTHEKLDAIGKEQAIACQVIVLLEPA